MTLKPDGRMPTQDSITQYQRIAEADPDLIPLCLKVKSILLDCAALHRTGAHEAVVGAKGLLRLSMLQLASLPAGNQREFRRKCRALEPEHLATADMTPTGIAMVMVGLERDRSCLEPRPGSDALDPGRRAVHLLATHSSFESLARGTERLMCDRAQLVELGETAAAERLTELIRLDALRATSVPAGSPLGAARKAAFIARLGSAKPPLSTMLDAALAFERMRWSAIPDASPRDLEIEPDAEVVPFGDRLTAYASWPDPTSSAPFLDAVASFAQDVALSAGADDLVRSGAMVSMAEAGIMAGAVPARSRTEAERKVEDLAQLIPDLGGGETLTGRMLTAALAWECDRWGFDLVVATETPRGPTH